MKLLVTHGYSFMGLLYGASMVMHVIICIPLAILLSTDCMNYLQLLTQDYFVILLIYHISNITLNVDLLSLLTMQTTGRNISNILCEYKINIF